MAKTSNTNKQESNTWVITMVFVVVVVIIALALAIWHQHHQLLSEINQSTAYSQNH